VRYDDRSHHHRRRGGLGRATTWKGKAKAKAGQSRLDQLVKWLGEDFDGVIAFDEAHNAGNAVPIKGERGIEQALGAGAGGGRAAKAPAQGARRVRVGHGRHEVSNLSLPTGSACGARARRSRAWATSSPR
jgi:hypothetical protein